MVNFVSAGGSNTPKHKSLLHLESQAVSSGTTALRNPTSFHIIDPAQASTKSSGFGQYIQEYIYAGGGNYQAYSDMQLETAYFSSVYLFAALRRVANLISRVKVVAEKQDGNSWIRLSDTARLNTMLSKDISSVMKYTYLNYALYGNSVIYKAKTVKALLSAKAGKRIVDYKDGAVAGLLTLDNPGWTLDESGTDGFSTINGVNLSYDYREIVGEKNYLERDEFIFIVDWNPRNKNRGRSIVTNAIHEAVTNSAIARWASEYFTRGALPLLLVSMVDSPAISTTADLLKQKRIFEEQWQGQASSLRSVFVDQKVEVNEVGITADRVSAPELNKNALEGISAAVGIERDLIIAPEGGTQSRHEAMIQQAWTDTIIPTAEYFLRCIQADLGLPSNIRLVLDLDSIEELEAQRGEKSTTEIALLEKSVQTINETRARLRQRPIEELDGFLMVNGVLMSIEKILQQDKIPDDRQFQQIIAAWDADLLLKSEAMKMLGRKLRSGERDGYKSELAVTQQELTSPDQTDLFSNNEDTSTIEETNTEDTPQDDSTEYAAPEQSAAKQEEVEKVDTVETTSITETLDDIDTLEEYEDPDLEKTEVNELRVLLTETVTQQVAKIENYVNLSLANNPIIVELQRKLKRFLANVNGIKWTDQDEFHITLFFAESQNSMYEQVTQLFPRFFSADTIEAEGLVLFDSADQGYTSVCLNLVRTPFLSNLQQLIYSTFRVYDVDSQEYTELQNWKPHITLCTVPINSRIQDFIYEAEFTCEGKVCVYENGELKSSIPVIAQNQNTYASQVSIDLLLENVANERVRNADLVKKWRDGEGFISIPQQIFDAISELGETPEVFEAAIQAALDGAFNDDVETDDYNPILKYMKGRQYTVKDELNAWKKCFYNNPNKALKKFEIKLIPIRVETYVKNELQDLETETVKAIKSSKIEDTFSVANKMIDDTAPQMLSENSLESWMTRLQQIGDVELLQNLGIEGVDNE